MLVVGSAPLSRAAPCFAMSSIDPALFSGCTGGAPLNTLSKPCFKGFTGASPLNTDGISSPYLPKLPAISEGNLCPPPKVSRESNTFMPLNGAGLAEFKNPSACLPAWFIKLLANLEGVTGGAPLNTEDIPSMFFPTCGSI